MYCKKCGVELEDNMLHCPLCGTSVADGGDVINKNLPVVEQYSYKEPHKSMKESQKRFTWEIVSIILVSATIGAVSIDLIINNYISWSEYPIAVNLVVFSYMSVFAFWDVQTTIRLGCAFLLSSVLLVSLYMVTSGIYWSVAIGIPILFTSSLVAALLVIIIRISRFKGINLIAYGFVAAAIQSVFVDGILSFFKIGSLHLGWSLIVVACIVPVVLVLLFVHFRLKRGRRLEGFFHT